VLFFKFFFLFKFNFIFILFDSKNNEIFRCNLDWISKGFWIKLFGFENMWVMFRMAFWAEKLVIVMAIVFNRFIFVRWAVMFILIFILWQEKIHIFKDTSLDLKIQVLILATYITLDIYEINFIALFFLLDFYTDSTYYITTLKKYWRSILDRNRKFAARASFWLFNFRDHIENIII